MDKPSEKLVNNIDKAIIESVEDIGIAKDTLRNFSISPDQAASSIKKISDKIVSLAKT